MIASKRRLRPRPFSIVPSFVRETRSVGQSCHGALEVSLDESPRELATLHPFGVDTRASTLPFPCHTRVPCLRDRVDIGDTEPDTLRLLRPSSIVESIVAPLAMLIVEKVAESVSLNPIAPLPCPKHESEERRSPFLSSCPTLVEVKQWPSRELLSTINDQ